MRIVRYAPPEPGDTGASHPMTSPLPAVSDDMTPIVSFPVTRRERRALERAAARRHITVGQLAYEVTLREALGEGRVPDPNRPAA